MKPQTKLSMSMTQAQFDNGYWYATEITEFAKAIGIPSASRLRKDELEKAIKVKAHFAVYPARHAKRPPVEAFLAWTHGEAARA